MTLRSRVGLAVGLHYVLWRFWWMEHATNGNGIGVVLLSQNLIPTLCSYSNFPPHWLILVPIVPGQPDNHTIFSFEDSCGPTRSGPDNGAD